MIYETLVGNGMEISMKTVYKQYDFEGMSVIYLKDDEKDVLGMTLLPTESVKDINLSGIWNIEPLVQYKLVGDAYGDGFSHGHTMKNASSIGHLKFLEQKVINNGKKIDIITKLEDRGLIFDHIVEHTQGFPGFIIHTDVTSEAPENKTFEMLSSYNITGFSCVGDGCRMEDFILHRMTSKWSMEGKLVSERFSDLNLEPAWIRIGANSVRFGQVGSMPVRRYFPWMIAEDEKYGYGIGIMLANPSSWQMEVYDKDDRISLSGGIADREFGHWTKNIAKGEVIETPSAIVVVAKEDVDGISYLLTKSEEQLLSEVTESEKELPIIFNEYCTSWGNPTEESLLKLSSKLKGHGIKYCVMDAGWHVKDGNDWSDIGDWITNEKKFPHGLKYVADRIKEDGMIPGIWFEMEIVGKDSDMFKSTDCLLKRDGLPITTCFRRFLDMRNPEVIRFLDERVIGNLKENGFGYLKVDYNDNIGIGCEGAESLGEGLRLNMKASQNFFRRIREEVPGIVIENCSSGGHRLEPSMMALADMASFSDAHEYVTIPIIAANVTRAILPRQSQIWAVLRAKDSEQRLIYSLAATFLGRMCLSGDIYDISDRHWELVDNAISLYKNSAEVIRKGRNYITRDLGQSMEHPTGWQAVCRVADSGTQMLIVVHTFENAPEDIVFPVPKGVDMSRLTIKEQLVRDGIDIKIESSEVIISGLKDFDGMVIAVKE